jgi:hypothetical protein
MLLAGHLTKGNRMIGMMRTFGTYDQAAAMWRECRRLGHGPHSIFWHEAEKKWAFWVL